jgi:RNA polymerase sigma-70 factor (ECF subfamily)
MSDAECDAELVRQVQGGNGEAFAKLLKRHARGAYLDCVAAFGPLRDPDDLAQELALRAWRGLRRGALHEPGRFGPWLSSIALNICRQRFRRDRKLRTMPDPDGVAGPGQNTGEPLVDHADELRHLMARVRALPAEYRQALEAYYFGELTYADLAKELKVTKATVNRRLWKAREMLRQGLGPTDL